MPILYKNIREGKEVSLSAAQYETHLADPAVFENLFFKSFPERVERFGKQSYRNGTILYTVKYKGIEKEVCILWGPLKNSGTEGVERKRIQVLPIVELKEETPYFAIGAYDTIDSVIYTVVLGGVREFIKHAQSGTAYSSFWIDYPSLWDAYKLGVKEWSDNKGRNLLACKSDKVENIHDAMIKLVGLISNKPDNDNSVPTSKESVEFVDFTEDVGKYETDESLPRNPIYREIALRRENYTCELCGTQNTFKDRNDEEYFEGHHLIMYNLSVQRRYKICLDHPSNIICLCPTCHRQIHHSSEAETKSMLITLFTKHNDLLKNYGIKSLNDIINDYTE